MKVGEYNQSDHLDQKVKTRKIRKLMVAIGRIQQTVSRPQKVRDSELDDNGSSDIIESAHLTQERVSEERAKQALEASIQTLEMGKATLERIRERTAPLDTVEQPSLVRVELEGETRDFVLGPPGIGGLNAYEGINEVIFVAAKAEGDRGEGSPLGMRLLGAKVGQEVPSDKKTSTCKVLVLAAR